MKQLLKSLLLILAMSLTATSVSAQRDRNYVKNAIKKWGSCKNVAITKTNGDVALHNRNAYAAGSVPVSLLNKLKQLNKNNNLIDDVQLTESGKWCVLFDDNGASWSDNIPSGLASKIREFNNNAYTVRSITFNDQNEWIIVSDQYFATSSTSLDRWLMEGLQNWGKLWAVCISDDAAVAVYQKGFCYRGNVPEALKEALRSTSFDVYRLKVAGTGWFFADINENYRYHM